MEKNLKIHLINQLKILRKANIFLNYKKNNYYNSSLNYLDSQEPNPGYGLIKYWNEGIKKLPQLLFFILKDLLISFYEYEFTTVGKNKNKKYNNIIITWSKNAYFLKDGSYKDFYFNTNTSLNKNCVWFLIHMDKQMPKKISKNIIVIKKKKIKFNYIKLLMFLLNIKNIFNNISEIIHRQSFQTIMANHIYNEFKPLLKKNVKKIIMPYEGQPFQNLIIKQSEKFNKNIKTIGFVHNFPPALPTNLIRRIGSPKKIIVCGTDQKYCLNKYLSWPKKDILISKSSRFINKNKDMSEIIFLPGYINSVNFIVKNLKKLILLHNYSNIRNFKIKIHPHKINSKIHIYVKKKISELFKRTKDNNYNTEKISIFFGSTGSIVEALECGCSAIHIVDDPALQIYGKNLFPNINIETIDKNIYIYSLKKKNMLLNFGKKKVTFNNYLKK